MHILAIDYGSKRIGLAWCDTGLGVVLPYGLIEEKNEAGKIEALAKLMQSEKIDKIICGLPTGLDGKENKNTEAVKKFVSVLRSRVTAPIEFFDERFTSRAADALGAGGASRDEKAAMLILENYLERLKNSKR